MKHVRSLLVKLYEHHIGYSPWEEDEDITDDEVAKLLLEYFNEIEYFG